MQFPVTKVELGHGAMGLVVTLSQGRIGVLDDGQVFADEPASRYPREVG